MPFLARAVFAVAVLIASFSAACAGKTFSHQGIEADAARYETYLQASWKSASKPAAAYKAEAEKVFTADPRAASRHLANAVNADAKNAGLWTRLAEALLAIKPDPEKDSERYDLPVHASGAAYRGYQLAATDSDRAAALYVLGQALERRSYWRPVIDAMKLSYELADNQGAHEAYDRLRAAYGFRMMDYRVDNEVTPPRVCLQFSEDLSRSETDVAKFVSVNGKDPESLTQDGKNLCVENLKHGDRFEIQIKAGFPSEIGETLTKNADLAIYVPDRSPLVRFTGKAYVLPSRGQQGIPVVTVNTKKINVEIYRIGDRSLAATLQSGDFQRQLSEYDVSSIRDRSGVKVYDGSMDVTAKINEEVTTAVPVTDAAGTLQPGAYVMIAAPAEKTKDDYGQKATQWFIVSDLGLTAFSGDDGVHAFVRSLADATPVAETTVKLVARNNEILATAKTDAKGYAKFDAAIANGDGGAAPAVLVAEKGAGEYAFLDLTLNAFDLSDRGVKGREPSGPIDAYVFTERGVYRGGEEVNVTALVRDKKGLASTVPMTLIVTRPDGVEQTRLVMNDQGLGGRALTVPLAKTAQTGTWRLWLYADPDDQAIAERAFLVEDFVPERLDMKLEAADKSLAPGARTIVNADGRYLYGPPAAALGLEGEVVVRLSGKDVAGFPGYSFGQADDFVNPVREALDSNLITDASGKAAIPVALPAIPKTARPLEADVTIRLRETGGRTIERQLTLPVDLHEPRIGIKPLFDRTVQEGTAAAFNVVMLDGSNKQVASNLDWTLTRLDTNWQWYRRDGSWTYEAVTTKRKIANGTLATLTDAAAKISENVSWGRYRLDIAASGAEGPASSYTFSSGWYTSGDDVESPEQLDVALDKESYKVGDVAKLRISTRLGGKLMVSVLGQELHASKEVEIAKGDSEVDIDVGSDWGPGAYVTAMLYRPMDETAKRMPSRAIGIAWLGLDQSQRELKVALTLPDKIKSGSELSVPVKIGGLNAGEDARVVVAAVDLGILNLTRFETPAPEQWFNAQQKLAFEIRDFYGRLIDGMSAERGKLRSGGDAAGPAMQGNPTVETVVSLYSGIVKVDANGEAKVEFDMPDFNGTVRVMAVAWSKDKIGHTHGDLIVRDKIALTVAVPRFMTLGDEIQLGFDVHNIEGPDAAYKIALARKEGDDSNEKLFPVTDRETTLKTGERKSERIAFKPQDVGPLTLKAVVTGPDDIYVKREMTFEVMPPAGDIKRTTISSLKAKGGKLSLTSDLVHDLIPSRTRINLSVGPAARFDVPSLLTQLDRYPYGCAEQTVSRAMPLLYANAVAAQIGIAEDKALKERVQKAVDRVFEMQDSSGAFGVWGPSEADLWLTAYVTDFLTRARETGVNVPSQGFSRALDRLQNFISYAEDFDKGGEDRAYALYVLARNGRAPVGELRYYADTRIDRFSTPLAKAQVGAALAMMGDKVRAERAFATALAAMSDATPDSGYRGDYGSTLRDGAALLTLASENGIAKEDEPKLASVIAKAYETRSYTSTQEQAWMLLAAKALNDEVANARLTVDGKPVSGPVLRGLTPAELKNGGLTITNDGDAAIDAVISVIGAALTPEPAVSKGFTIERQAYTLDGKPADLKSMSGGTANVKQNDRFVIALRVTSSEEGGRVLIVDHLPAGFEIENPHLVDSGAIANIDWLKTTASPEHTEFRDDRFVAAMSFSGGNVQTIETPVVAAAPAKPGAKPDAQPQATTKTVQATLAYIVRAVTPGAYVHPAATVEDMYRPERYARTAAGKLVVSTKE